jgi:hypothetical protein
MISNEERINLQKLVGEFESEDNTEHIRNLKHSGKIRSDIEKIQRLNVPVATETAMVAAPFLYANYTDIFHRVVKGDLDLAMMNKVLDVLSMIEEKRVDQHEGSVLVGRLLKDMYLDSAVRRADRLDEENPKELQEEGKPVSWKEYQKFAVNGRKP